MLTAVARTTALAAALVLTVGGSPAGDREGRRTDAGPKIRCHDVAARGDVVFAARTGGLAVVDLSNPYAPDTIASVDVPGEVTGVAVMDDLVLLAAGSHGLVVVDAAEAERPRVVSRFAAPGSVRRVAAKGRTAYLAAGDDGLLVLDLGDPARPRRTALLSSRGRVRGLAVSGDRLATAEVGAGCRLFDVSRPDLPRETARLADSEGAIDVAIDGMRVWIAGGRGGLWLYVLGERRPTTVERTVVVREEVREIVAADGRIYASQGSRGVRILEFDSDDRLRETAPVALPRSFPAGRIAVRGHLVFVAADVAGFAVIDISDPRTPEVLFPREKAFQIVWD